MKVNKFNPDREYLVINPAAAVQFNRIFADNISFSRRVIVGVSIPSVYKRPRPDGNGSSANSVAGMM